VRSIATAPVAVAAGADCDGSGLGVVSQPVIMTTAEANAAKRIAVTLRITVLSARSSGEWGPAVIALFERKLDSFTVRRVWKPVERLR
jgi:hypothetical protein